MNVRGFELGMAADELIALVKNSDNRLAMALAMRWVSDEFFRASGRNADEQALIIHKAGKNLCRSREGEGVTFTDQEAR